jgi:hypothetical protein
MSKRTLNAIFFTSPALIVRRFLEDFRKMKRYLDPESHWKVARDALSVYSNIL